MMNDTQSPDTKPAIRLISSESSSPQLSASAHSSQTSQCSRNPVEEMRARIYKKKKIIEKKNQMIVILALSVCLR